MSWGRDECIKFWGQKFKVQGHGVNVCWNRHCTGGSIQYLMSRVELDFLGPVVPRAGNLAVNSKSYLVARCTMPKSRS